jgi:hypothetical protein
MSNKVKCPECDEEGAYIGFVEIKCPNSKCIHYDEEQHLERAFEALQEFEQDIKNTTSDPDKTPAYPWRLSTLPFGEGDYDD